MVKWYPQAALATLMLACLNLAGCAAVKGIFKAGVWVGVIGVALVIGLIFAIGRMFSRS